MKTVISNVLKKTVKSHPVRLTVKMLSVQTKHKLSLCLLRHPQNLGFDLSMNVSICVTSKTFDRKSNQGYTFVEAVSFRDVVFLEDLDLR